MSKLSFRARALDPSKQMPIYLAEELPDLPEYSAINRAVPQMPSGMEKEEESEHHLQRAICTGLIIPTPEVFTTDQDFYDSSYPPNYKMPRQLIHMQPLGLDNDVPEYDMDSSDETWVKEQSQRLDLTPIKFEQMMNRLERSSGQTVVTLNEAKALLKQSDELSIAVYDYWLNKRLKTQHPLILAVKTENRPGVSSNNPYLAFRRRTEKMQTRKNRKNDETSYEKMLKLRRDLQRATTMLEMVKKREKTKKEQLRLSIEIFEKRVELRDFNGTLFNELCATLKSIRPAFAPLYSNQYSHNSSSLGVVPSNGPSGSVTNVLGVPNQQNFLGVCNNSSTNIGNIYTTSQYLSSTIGMDATNTTGGSISRKEKRQYKKRKHKLQRDKQKQPQQYSSGVNANMSLDTAGGSSLYSMSGHSGLQNLNRNSSSIGNESNIETEEEEVTSGGSHLSSKFESEVEEETPFAFRRKQNCNYLKPLDDVGSWPWESTEEKRDSDLNYRFTLTSLRNPRPKCIGFARRRIGRGGRIILDRVATDLDALWAELDYTILESGCANILNENIKQEIPSSTLNDSPAKSPKVKTENTNFEPMKSNNRLHVRLSLRDDVDIENSYVSELTIPNKKKRNVICDDYEEVINKFEGEFKNQHNYSTSCKDNIPSNNLPHRHVLKISQTLKRSGIPNLLLHSNKDNDDSLLEDTEKNNLTEQKTKQIGLNNNVNSNLNKNVSIGEKQNVIKCEAQQTTENVLVSIKEEVTDSDSPRIEPIKDCNGVFNSVYRSISSADICDDEENVNLAQLSNIMRHTIKRETSEQVITTEKEKVKKSSNENISTKTSCCVENDVLWNEETLNSLSPTSSLRLEACNDLLNEIRNDWLHFRPKTPSNEISDDEKDRITCENNIDHTIVNWSQSTPISVEIVGASQSKEENSLWTKKQNEEIFISDTFKYDEIEADSGILKSVYPICDLGLKLKSTEYSSAPASKLIGLNLSGESLNDINLLGESEETNSNMLDNILQQCQIDEISHTTNFWNGILDADAAIDEDGAENSGKMLDFERKNEDDTLDSKLNKNKNVKTNVTQGSTTFSVVPLMIKNEVDFFKKSSSKSRNTSNLNNNSPEVIKEDLSSCNGAVNVVNNQKLSGEKLVTKDSLSVLEKLEDTSVKNNPQDIQHLQVRHIAVQNPQIQRQQILLQMQPDIVTSSGNTKYMTSQNSSTIISRQPTLTPIRTPSSNNHVIYTTCSGDVFPVSHKVAYIQKAQSINPNTVIALSNVKVENEGTQNATVLSQPSVNNVVGIDGNNAIGTTQSINIIGGSSVSGTPISSTSPLIVTTAGRSQHFTQQVQVNASQPQIVWRQISAAPNTTATSALITTSADSISGNKIVWTNRGGQKRHINGTEGAEFNRLLLNRKPSQRKVISQHSTQVQISKQPIQPFQRDNDGSILSAQGCSTLESGHEGLSTTSQKLHGKVIKIPSFPLLVSELQQKQNSVSIASSQNFSLPNSQMISTQQVQSTNKIVLSGAGSSSCSNAASDLQSNSNISQMSANPPQKVHYKEIPNSNMKLNFVSNTSSGNVGQANLLVDTKTIANQPPSTVLLNKSATSLQQQKLKTGANIDNSKRVLYTSLLNVKNLQKTPSGQMQMQIGTGGMTHAVLRGRIANNQAIFTTNMRAVPIGTTVSSPGPQTQTLGTIVSGSITNNTFQDSQLKIEAPHLTKPNETSKNPTDQSNCNNSISSVSTTIGNIKLGNSVIISATSSTNKNTIVTNTTNR